MAHFSLIRSPVTLWATASTVLASELVSFDANISASIDGDNGGTWLPIIALTINGSGLATPVLLQITRGGTWLSTAAHGIQCNDNDVPLLSATHTGRVLKKMFSFSGATSTAPFMWRTRREDGALQSLAGTYNPLTAPSSAYVNNALPVRCQTQFRAHDRSTITSVTVNFRVGVLPTDLPGLMPGVRVCRMEIATGIVTPLTSHAAGAVTRDGAVFIPRPADPATWFLNGIAQSITVSCDQNNVVDLGTYAYFVEIREQNQTPYGGFGSYPTSVAFKPRVACATTSDIAIGLSGASVIDGVTLTDGMRVLVKSQTDSTQNGIYIFKSPLMSGVPGFVRDFDLNSSSDFSQGFCVLVQQGLVNSGTIWQVASTQTSWPAFGIAAAAPKWVALTAYAVGQLVVPTNPTGVYFLCTQAGTSAGTEPVWPPVISATPPTDGTVKWVCQGYTTGPMNFVTRPDGPALEGTAIIPHGNIWQSFQVQFSNIVDTGPQ